MNKEQKTYASFNNEKFKQTQVQSNLYANFWLKFNTYGKFNGGKKVFKAYKTYKVDNN